VVIPTWYNSDRNELSKEPFGIAKSLPIEKQTFDTDPEPTPISGERIAAVGEKTSLLPDRVMIV